MDWSTVTLTVFVYTLLLDVWVISTDWYLRRTDRMTLTGYVRNYAGWPVVGLVVGVQLVGAAALALHFVL